MVKYGTSGLIEAQYEPGSSGQVLRKLFKHPDI